MQAAPLVHVSQLSDLEDAGFKTKAWKGSLGPPQFRAVDKQLELEGVRSQALRGREEV